jgi:nanoRNase/pAp phosphatase (c-di-AMP/oligoRNAs hydrolase)
MDDMRLVVGVDLAIGYKLYSDGKITAKIRCNFGSPIANDLATEFGGGGHPYAAGFKILNGTSLEDLKIAVENKASELLDNLKRT